MGSGAFEFVEHVQGSHWVGKRFEGYFKPGRPYLDGFKAYFVKSTAVVPGLLGGQFDAEFRFRTPPERDSARREARRQGRRLRAAAAGRQHHHLQHQEEALRRHPRAPGADARHRPLDRRREHRQDLVAALSRRRQPAGLQDGLAGGGAGEASGLLEGCGEPRAGGAAAAQGGGPGEPGLQVPQPRGHRELHDGRHLRRRPMAPHRRQGDARAARDQDVPGEPGDRELRRRHGVHLRLPRRSHAELREVPEQEAHPARLLGPRGRQDRRRSTRSSGARSIPSSAPRSCASSTGTC